jgi:hypothetical protein
MVVRAFTIFLGQNMLVSDDSSQVDRNRGLSYSLDLEKVGAAKILGALPMAQRAIVYPRFLAPLQLQGFVKWEDSRR